MPESPRVSRGYLNEDFRLFHIRDKRDKRFDYHFHPFDKIVVFLSGKVTYLVEDKAYHLKPWDVLIIRHDQLHRPIIDPDETYERIILYVNADFLEMNSTADGKLTQCIETAESRRFNLLRLEAQDRAQLMTLLSKLEDALGSAAFSHELLSKTLFLQTMILLNRIALRDDTPSNAASFTADPKISEIMAYILENLADGLSIDAIARRFYVSKSFLMHRFRDVTGYAPHSYIQLKRLLLAAQLIDEGESVTVAAKKCGYNDYSAFSRAYKKRFGVSPTRRESIRLSEDDVPAD